MGLIVVIFKEVSIPHRYAKNQVKIKKELYKELFQFLIGTLKTILKLSIFPLRKGVSIPHRYAKNGIRGGTMQRKNFSFNSS